MQDIDWTAYQIAENTQRSRHDSGCRSWGLGRVVRDLDPGSLCNCSILPLIRQYLVKKYGEF